VKNNEIKPCVREKRTKLFIFNQRRRRFFFASLFRRKREERKRPQEGIDPVSKV